MTMARTYTHVIDDEAELDYCELLAITSPAVPSLSLSTSRRQKG
jgi:hypothetical protein